MTATLQFVPVARLGLGDQVTVRPGALRADVAIQTQVGGKIGAASAPTVPGPPLSAQLLGPGDVLAIDPRVVIRADPGPHAQGAPAHALVAIELSRPDFPWMFSPFAPGTVRPQPWLCLVVVPQRPGIALQPRGDGRLPVLTVDDGRELPDLAEAWAWAHAQVLSDDAHPVAPTLRAGDARSLSRLLSPRRLEPATAYLACLVPTYNVGRQIGLDPTADPAGPLAPAWSAAVPPGFQLPVYYSWSFSTGAAGDFHDLVVRLRPRALPPAVGSRPVSVPFPSRPVPAAFHPFAAPLEGALRNLADPPPVTDPGVALVARELVRLGKLPHTVAPPRWGQAQAGAIAPWLDELAGAPMVRVAAGAGARVVQAQQDELMASAWEQIGEMLRANQQRRQAELALAVGETLMRRHFSAQAQPMAADRVLQVTAPTKLAALATAAAAAGIPAATLSGTFRRLLRRSGPLARRTAPAAVVLGLDQMALPQASAILPSAMTQLSRTLLGKLRPEMVGAAAAAVLPFSDADAAAPGHTGGTATWEYAGLMLSDDVPGGSHRPQQVHTTQVVRGASVPWRLDDGSQFQRDDNPAALAHRQNTANNFKAAAIKVQDYLWNHVLPRSEMMVIFKPPPPTSDASAARKVVLDALSPARTVVGRTLTFAAVSTTRPSTPSRGTLGTAGVSAAGVSTAGVSTAGVSTASTALSGPAALAPLSWSPVFPQPMFRALAELSPDLFLVGADHIPDDTVGLVRTNPRFIEAYLVGLNHEMARELLWRGFPSDGRGTMFRRFWDGDHYPALQAWRAALGRNGDAADHLVLVIRGELVRRYPRVVVFAQRGAIDAGGRFVPGAEPRRYPLFRASIAGDLLCVGFDFARADAFSFLFGLEEQLTEPRFAPTVTAAGTHLRVAELPAARTAHSGQIAALLLRRPVRVIIDPHQLIAT